MNFYKTILFITILFSPSILFSQNHRFKDLKSYEDTLVVLQNIIYSTEPLSIRESKCEVFINLFKEVLNVKGSFQFPFDSLKHIGKITSSDDKVKLYTINLPLSAGTQKYYGFIQHQVNKRTLQIFVLNDKRELISDPINEILSAEKWLGSLYYSIVSKTIKGQRMYILLGIDFNNLFSAKKLIEVLSFDSNNIPVFGAPIFKVGNTTLSRIVFEYSAKATMGLRLNEEDGMIVFDHLSPSRPDFAGNFQFYGPDFTYDGFKYENDYWVYVQDLDLRNPDRERTKVINAPEKLPEPGFLYKSNTKY